MGLICLIMESTQLPRVTLEYGVFRVVLPCSSMAEDDARARAEYLRTTSALRAPSSAIEVEATTQIDRSPEAPFPSLQGCASPIPLTPTGIQGPVAGECCKAPLRLFRILTDIEKDMTNGIMPGGQ